MIIYKIQIHTYTRIYNSCHTLLHLSPAERDGPCRLGPLRGSPGGCVGSLVALDAHMAGYQVESPAAPVQRDCRLPRMAVTRPTLSLGRRC